MERVKRTARVIEPDRWPDSAGEDLAYWQARSPSERVDFSRRLLTDAYRRVHGRPLPRVSRVGRVFQPEP